MCPNDGVSQKIWAHKKASIHAGLRVLVPVFPLYPRFFKTYIYVFIYFKIYIFRKYILARIYLLNFHGYSGYNGYNMP